MKDLLPLTAVIMAVIALTFSFLGNSGVDLGARSGVQVQACTMNTTQTVTLGNQASTEVLAAYSNRAWARIQQLPNATNTVYLALDEGTAATAASGVHLLSADAVSTSTDQLIDFGRSTDLPYTGAVTALTDTASTTILVSECRY